MRKSFITAFGCLGSIALLSAAVITILHLFASVVAGSLNGYGRGRFFNLHDFINYGYADHAMTIILAFGEALALVGLAFGVQAIVRAALSRL